MAPVSGTAGSVVVISGGTTVVGYAHEWSIDMGQETPETTAFGDGWRTYVNGIKAWTASVQLRTDPADGAQTTIRTLMLGGSAAVVFRFAQGANYYSGSAIPTGHNPSIAFDGVGALAYDLQGSGPLSYT